MRTFLKTIIGGGLGLAALYLVAYGAYSAGKKVAKEECRYAQLKSESEKMEKELR